MSWVVIREFDQMNEEVLKERKRWEDVAEDVGLLPERNVCLEEENGKIKVLISQEMHDFFSGNY